MIDANLAVDYMELCYVWLLSGLPVSIDEMELGINMFYVRSTCISGCEMRIF